MNRVISASGVALSAFLVAATPTASQSPDPDARDVLSLQDDLVIPDPLPLGPKEEPVAPYTGAPYLGDNVADGEPICETPYEAKEASGYFLPLKAALDESPVWNMVNRQYIALLGGKVSTNSSIKQEWVLCATRLSHPYLLNVRVSLRPDGKAEQAVNISDVPFTDGKPGLNSVPFDQPINSPIYQTDFVTRTAAQMGTIEDHVRPLGLVESIMTFKTKVMINLINNAYTHSIALLQACHVQALTGSSEAFDYYKKGLNLNHIWDEKRDSLCHALAHTPGWMNNENMKDFIVRAMKDYMRNPDMIMVAHGIELNMNMFMGIPPDAKRHEFTLDEYRRYLARYGLGDSADSIMAVGLEQYNALEEKLLDIQSQFEGQMPLELKQFLAPLAPDL